MRYMQHAAQLLLLAALVGCDGGRVAGPGTASDAQPSTQVVPAGPTLTLAGVGIENDDDDCPPVDEIIGSLNRDDDNDGLTNKNETLLGLLSNDDDSDDDGVLDGNDDSNGNGMDDEDEDDDDCPDDLDSDEDGTDDEDEDDEDEDLGRAI